MTSVRQAWVYVKALHVDELFTDPKAIAVSPEFKAVATDSSVTYEEVYLTGLARGEYNILLADYAFLQFGGSSENSLRYAYYPNPFLNSSRQAINELADLREYVDEGILDMDEYLQRVAELRFTQHPPLLRYENAPGQHVDMVHPCSHIHLGHHAGNRWPVRRVMTPAAFTLMLLKLFYSEYWNEAQPLGTGKRRLSLDEAFIRAKQECRILPDDLFSVRASQQFFLG